MVVQPEQVASKLARSLPRDVLWIVKELEGKGFETWVVGGAVRDAVSGSPVDWDFATKATPKQMRSVFRRTIPIGVEHGTLGVIAPSGDMYEVTTFRKDVETTGRHAVVSFADRIDDDLSRRDFTFNAMAWHPQRKDQPDALLDPHGGLHDLNAGVLRTVGAPEERFREDYLRILRALRFAGRLDLDIEEKTWTALVAGTAHLGILSGERVREELLKVLGGAVPSRALSLYRRSGALAVIFPELEAGSGSAFQEALNVVDRIGPHHILARLAALMSAATGGEHDSSTLASVLKRMKALRFSNEEMAAVRALLEVDPLPESHAPDEMVRRWLSRFDGDRLRDLFRMRIARARTAGSEGSGHAETTLAVVLRVRSVLHARPPLRVGDLALDGNDLKAMGLKPGPHFRRLLETLLEEVLEDPARNTRDYLSDRTRTLVEAGSL